MKTNLSRWGNCLVVWTPQALAQELSRDQGAEGDLQVPDGVMVVAPMPRPRCELDDLVREVTPDNRPPEVDWGAPVGSEVW